ncbi:uncharacterized protein [Coffea arabica]|uniref:Uncharacterized protein n=1 Tax=Coffea arabica TaxID=13443 RepID=A0A6P6XBB6_COFAR|nr:uncharacterized protein LOC113740848 [Coffea arabica]
MDDHLKLRIFYDHEKDQRSYNYLQEGNKKPSEEGLPWNLRSRPTTCKTGCGRLTPVMQQSQKGIDGKASGSSTWLQRPKFLATLSNEEIETDFLLLTGAKPSRRPKKRSRSLQKQFHRFFPGSWPTELISEKYKVHEHPEPKSGC